MTDEQRIARMMDKAEITEVIIRERSARDDADWDTMTALHHPDSFIEVSWFKGSAAEFISRSREQYWSLKGLHQLGVTLVETRGDRALARTWATVGVVSPTFIAGVEVQSESNVRLHFRLVRGEGGWQIRQLVCEYLTGSMSAAIPGQTVPIDEALLATFRRSYRFASYAMAANGTPLRQDLPGADRPEIMSALMLADQAWLAADPAGGND